MARRPTGWKLRQKHGPGSVFTVRFWIGGREFERSTGSSNAQEAAQEAGRIYATAVGIAGKTTRRVRRGSRSLEELAARWLVDLESTHAATTIVTWGKLTNRWLNFFAATHHINEAMCERYMLTRLREVLSQTVVGELSTLTIFIRWLHAQGELPEVVKVPTVPPRSLGTPSKMPGRKAAFAVSPDECRRMIDLLPVMSKGSSNAKPYPVRARFIVAYATSLRPTTLHKLRAGIHHTKGAELVTLTRDVDKARFAREVPLIEEAQKAFDSVYPKEHGGLLFGDHDYRGYVKRAAIKVLGLERGRNFNAAHFRSACITHLLEDTDNVAGAQWMAGHLRMSTTARYVKTSLRAGKAAVEVAEAKRRARAKQRPLKRRAA